MRRLRRRARARQRGGRGRSPGGTPGFVAGRVALWTGSAGAVLSFLLCVAHLHLLTVGSDPVLQRQRTVLQTRRQQQGDIQREIHNQLRGFGSICTKVISIASSSTPHIWHLNKLEWIRKSEHTLQNKLYYSYYNINVHFNVSCNSPFIRQSSKY